MIQNLWFSACYLIISTWKFFRIIRYMKVSTIVNYRNLIEEKKIIVYNYTYFYRQNIVRKNVCIEGPKKGGQEGSQRFKNNIL